MVRAFHVACLLTLFAAFVHSQASPEQATVAFTLDFPGSHPEHYSLQVQSDGKARYESSRRPAPDSEETDGFDYEFTLSPAARQRVFDLAAKAGYFHRDLDSHRKNVAFTGRKTISYKDARHSGESTYNYSPDPAVQELTNLFQNLSATVELGHQLEYDHRYQKLALDEELKRAEEMARTTPPVALQAIAPILEQIIADSSVINVTRARAQRLLERAGAR